MASEDEEVAALDRVLTRTVLTKDDDLQQLLAKLLPALVQKLATAQPKTRAKVLELLSHINKRVRALPGCSLPLLPLLQLAVGASPMVASFGLVYVEMGQPRASPEEQLQAVPLLLSGISRRAQQHRAVALRVATAALSLLQQAPGGNYSQVIAVTDKSSRSSSSSSKPVAAVSLLPPAPEDRAVLLRHALKLMLYQRPSSGSRAAPTPLGLANAAAAAAAAGAPAAAQAAAAAAPPPPGLSAADVLLLEEKGVPSQDQLVALKLGLLALLGGAAAGMPGNAAAAAAVSAAGGGAAAAGGKAGVSEGSTGAAMDVDSNAGDATAATAAAAAAAAAPVYLSSQELLLVLLAASCDPYEAVARRGADLLQKLVNPDAAKPAVDLESQALVGGLTTLLLGDQDPGAPQPAAAPAGPALAVRIMQLLVRSVAAAQAFPAAPLVLSACMYGPASSPRLLRLGAEWAGWMFKHAPAHQLRAMAGPLLQRLLAALGLEGAEGGDAMQVDGAPAAGGTAVAGLAGSAEARGHVFSALAQLSQRLPDLFQSDTALASRLFAALGAEPPGSRTALQEALGGLAAAMGQGIQGAAGSAAAAGAAGTATAGAAAADGGGGLPASKVEELEGLLLSSIGSEQAAVRLCAAQWAAKLFPRSHMPSRYVCLLAAGDAKPEVREAGLTGLGLSATQLPADAAAAPSAYAAAVAGLGLPLPGAVVGYLVAQHRQLAQPGDLSRPLPLPDASCKALAAFLRAAATATAHGSSSSSSSGPDVLWAAGYSLTGHALLLEGLACRAAGRDTVCAALEGLVELLGGTAPWLVANGGSSTWQVQVAELRERASTRQAWLCHWLAHHHQPVRLAAARLTALAAAAAQPAAAEALLQQLLAALPPLGSAAAAAGVGGGGSRLEEQEGSLLAAGLMLARSASCGSPCLPPELQQSALAAITQQLRHHSGSTAGAGGSSNGNAASSAAGGRSLVLAGAAALALGFVSLAGQAALPGLLTDGSSSGGDAAPAAAAAGRGSDSVAPPAAAAAAVTGGAGSAASSYSTGSIASGSVLGVLLSLAGNGKDSRAALRAVAAVGYIAAGSGDQQVHLAAAKGLLALSSTKGLSEELLLGLGEAAAAAAGDASSFDPALLLWSNLDSIADCVDAAEAAAAGGSAAAGTALPGQQADQQQAAAMDVDTAAAVEGSSGSSSSSRGGVQEYLLAELGKMAVAPKEEVRCAACLLLVSLLQLCKGSGLLAGRLPQLQATFTGLLGDSNELTQDLAARGVSLVYSRGGAPLQQQLLGQLLGLLQGGPGAPAAAAAGAAGVKLAGDSKLFEEGQLGATPGGGGLTTYRELCSLANDLGQPDLVYRFMDLARASSALSAKRGAAVGVARIARLAAAATPGGTGQPGGGSGLASLLGPARLASLLPKLYRLCHDPSPKVSDSMSAIWAALLDDPRAAVDAHYDDIMKSLLADVGARLWRVRQAACASLTDLLAGRRWPQLAPHMEQLWVMGLRAADDVKESVRGAAGGLVRSLRGLSLRLMDAAQSPAADVAGCCGVVLPLLAGSQGLGSSMSELRGVAADVLCSGIKSAGSAQVLPVLSSVVPVLLEALSGMEDARLNYVEQHAESIGLDADQLAAARLAAARSSSITEALDAASRALTGAAAVEMAPALADLVRRGVGLSSKVGAASFMRGLATRLGQELKPAAPTLLKPLVAGVARESSAPVKRAYAAAAAAVAARCCGDKHRDKFVADAVASYCAVEVQLQPWRPGVAAAAAAAAPMAVDEPSGGGEDASRQAGGLLLRELLRESSDTFNAYAAQVLPVAFVASHDEVPPVASAWAAVWSQGCPSEPAALRLHAAELARLLAGGLGSSAWPRKRAAAKALSALAEVAPDQLGPYSPALAQLLLAEASGGRLWEGKEGLMACLGGLGAACASTLAQQPGVDVLLGGLLSAAARKKTSYRAAALAAMQKVLVALLPLTRTTTTAPPVVDGSAVWGTVSPPLLNALQQHLAAASAPVPAAKANAAAGAAEPADEVKPLPLPETCSCLGAALKLTPDAARAAAAPLLVKLMSGLMAAAGLSWTNWLAVVTLAQAVVEAAAPAGASTAAGGGSVPAAACVPLAGGLVHVIQHSTISQLRGKCLEVLVQLLQTFEGDAEASRAFLSADADASSISGVGSESAATGGGAGSSSLSSIVARCMATVASQDPSAAHTALAGRATAVLQRLNST